MTIKRDTTRNNKKGNISHINAGQYNPIGEKESQEHTKESDIHPLPVLGVTQEHQATSRNICTEDLVQTPAGLVLDTSVSVSPCDPCLVDSVDHVLLVSSIPFDSYNFSLPSCMGFPELRGEGPDGYLQSRLPQHKAWLWVFFPVSICCQRKSVWWQLDKYEDSRVDRRYINVHTCTMTYHSFLDPCCLLYL